MRFFMAICLFNSFICSAVEITPMVVTIDPLDSSRPAYTTVQNLFNRNAAFEIEVFEVDFSAPEPRFRLVEEPPVWVFPPTLLLQKNQSQRVQLRWLGNLPDTDKTYQISFIEQPLNLDEPSERSRLIMLLTLNLIVHIKQDSLEPYLVVNDSSCFQSICELWVGNNGKGAARLSEYKVILELENKRTITYEKQELKSEGYDVFFAPLSESKVILPLREVNDVLIHSPKVTMSR
ncbi:hypothetical protein [Pseudoalteromonas sp. MB47]|uniref:hypothetical protein n=1 Tax=Pseudoalteromonas sp. MB47 TaxID=2588452 RepID=UPI00140C6CC3|nr:hypothetical protein [Pseudoalteromonas sp. MB47]NHH88355.1 hypothetical protein [Pseudoalteromonas sp. MB47]